MDAMSAGARGLPAAWWRRALLAAGVVTIALCIIGMHQLSRDHSFATAELDHSAHQHPVAIQAKLSHFLDSAALALNITASVGPPTVAVAPVPEPAVSVAPEPDRPSSQSVADRCGSCGHQAMLFASCLLALTLLVLRWRLAPPGLRRIAQAWNLWVPSVATWGRLRPPLSLVELSLRRT